MKNDYFRSAQEPEREDARADTPGDTEVGVIQLVESAHILASVGIGDKTDDGCNSDVTAVCVAREDHIRTQMFELPEEPIWMKVGHNEDRFGACHSREGVGRVLTARYGIIDAHKQNREQYNFVMGGLK